MQHRPQLHAINWETAAILYARIGLGTAFLSAVAGRFGLWQGTFDWGSFAKFQQYAAQVNSFMPSAVIPLIAWTATVAETTLGVLLILGLWSRWVSLGSAILLAMLEQPWRSPSGSSRRWITRSSRPPAPLACSRGTRSASTATALSRRETDLASAFAAQTRHDADSSSVIAGSQFV